MAGKKQNQGIGNRGSKRTVHAKTNPQTRNSRESGPKVGSDQSAAAHFADRRDFGIPVGEAGKHTEAAEEAKYQPEGDHHTDPRQPRSSTEGSRESGAGGVDSGPGSSSGGDLDTDLVGVGTHGSGVSMAGPDARKGGPDMIQSGSNSHKANAHHSRTKMRGTTVNQSEPDTTTIGNGTGASTVTPVETGDDAAAGEISQGEAVGDDNTDIDNFS
jgi:hypothetical protein